MARLQGVKASPQPVGPSAQRRNGSSSWRQRAKARQCHVRRPRQRRNGWRDYRDVLFSVIEVLYRNAVFIDTVESGTKNVLWSAEPKCPLVMAERTELNFGNMADVAQRLTNVLRDEDYPEGKLPDAGCLCTRLRLLGAGFSALADLQQYAEISPESLSALNSVEFSALTFMETADRLAGFAQLNFGRLSWSLTQLRKQMARWREGIMTQETYRLTAPSYQAKNPW